MPDAYAALRSLPFPSLATALGIDLAQFRRDNRGQEWVGPCPIHGSQKNKGCFRYNDSGVYHCFSKDCKGSGALDLTMAVKQIGFKSAVELLQGVQVPPAVEKPRASDSGASRSKAIDVSSYKKHAVWPCEWLEARGLSKETCDRFGVFLYDNPGRKSTYKGRVLIPFTNYETGKVDGFMGRYIGSDAEQSKYLVPSGFPKSSYLFGSAELKNQAPLKKVYLVESAFCCMKFTQFGFPCVAAYGWSLSEEQIIMLGSLSKGVVWIPDLNKRQEIATTLSILASKLWVRAPRLPDGVDDPEKLSCEQIRALI